MTLNGLRLSWIILNNFPSGNEEGLVTPSYLYSLGQRIRLTFSMFSYRSLNLIYYLIFKSMTVPLGRLFQDYFLLATYRTPTDCTTSTAACSAPAWTVTILPSPLVPCSLWYHWCLLFASHGSIFTVSHSPRVEISPPSWPSSVLQPPIISPITVHIFNMDSISLFSFFSFPECFQERRSSRHVTQRSLSSADTEYIPKWMNGCINA